MSYYITELMARETRVYDSVSRGIMVVSRALAEFRNESLHYQTRPH